MFLGMQGHAGAGAQAAPHPGWRQPVFHGGGGGGNMGFGAGMAGDPAEECPVNEMLMMQQNAIAASTTAQGHPWNKNRESHRGDGHHPRYRGQTGHGANSAGAYGGGEFDQHGYGHWAMQRDMLAAQASRMGMCMLTKPPTPPHSSLPTPIVFPP